MSEQEKFDGILYQLVSATGGYDGFFDQIFSFCRRKTDFFVDQKRAEETIAKAGKKHIEAFLKDAAEKKAQEAAAKERQTKREPEAEVKKAAPSAPPKVEKEPQVAPSQPPEPKSEKLAGETEEKKSDEVGVEGGEEKSTKLKPNSGNGSQTDSYVWTQTLEEVQAVIPIEKGIKARDLTIKLEGDSCLVARKDGSKVYLEGRWPNKVHVDDSVWTIEEAANGDRSVQMNLMKWRNTQMWWDCLVQGEAPVDTQKINPEPSKLSDLDGEMKATVGKMMFDMQQKQKGLPSSDELEKQDKLKAFMKAHPEMDFSKAKFG